MRLPRRFFAGWFGWFSESGTWREVVGITGAGREWDALQSSERGLDRSGTNRLELKAATEMWRFMKIELFDNREWNQNVRGELEVVRGLQGP